MSAFGRSSLEPCRGAGRVARRRGAVRRCADLFGKWLALSPVAIVLGRTAIAAAALGICAARARASAVRRAPHRQRRRARRPLAELLRRNPGLDSGRRLARLRELPAVHAARGARVSRAAAAPARSIDGLAGDIGLVLLVPELSFGNPTVQGLAGALSRDSRSRCSR
jgi:hypothetical protein